MVAKIRVHFSFLVSRIAQDPCLTTIFDSRKIEKNSLNFDAESCSALQVLSNDCMFAMITSLMNSNCDYDTKGSQILLEAFFKVLLHSIPVTGRL